MRGPSRGVGDRVVEAQSGAVARGGIPSGRPDATAGGPKERGGESGVDGILALAVAVCGYGSSESCGAIVLGPHGSERGEPLAGQRPSAIHRDRCLGSG